ncbi:MAG: hydroxysqualene dehydroxylase HpnE [Bacteroidota bacterium]|nr:hydroxysqualene dehydroxylase HpnE [Bacteroidota bacterium]
MKKVIVIGGGLAGLSAAAFLSDAGLKTEVIENSPKLGGRAYSFTDNNTKDIIDNGQHIMMGCYTNTLHFLKLINSLDTIKIQSRLSVNFVDRQSGLSVLKAITKLYPLNLLLGLLSFKALSFKDRFGILKLFSRLPFKNKKSVRSLSVEKWLKNENQSIDAIKKFWEILAVGALNSDIKQASACVFINILKKMFLYGNKAASIIIPKTGLSQMYCPASEKFITERGGVIALSEQVRSLEVENGKITKIVTQKRIISGFDYVVSAVAPHSFEKILPNEYKKEFPFEKIKYSSILSVHIWLKENRFTQEFYGLIDSPLHWVFNHDRYITVVTSNSDHLLEKGKEELLEMICCELKKYFKFFDMSAVTSYKVIKEKRATFIPEESFLNYRPSVRVRSIKNLFMAGDWTDTGLPATIEGAVLSGKNAAREIVLLPKA